MSSETQWHALSLGEVFAHVGAKKDGLSSVEAARRREHIGANEIPRQEEEMAVKTFFRQLLHPLILLLIGAGVVTLFLNAWLDAIVIFLVVVLNASVGFYQERKARKALESLHKEEEYFSLVLRDGSWRRVSAVDLVPGDIIQLRAGDHVPADGRLIAETELDVQEALLTGESMPVGKSVDPISPDVERPARTNMVWKGSAVVEGKGEALVVATGAQTAFGSIGKLTQQTRQTQTPFERRVMRLGRFLGIAALGAVFVLFTFGIAVGRPLTEMFLISVAVTVSAIPEGLPIALTAILSIGMIHILKRGGLVKTLEAAQALGSTSVILTDKTGTLTEGQMRVSRVFGLSKRGGIIGFSDDEEAEKTQLRILQMGAFTTDVVVENPAERVDAWRIRGSATERAIVQAAHLAGLTPLRQDDVFVPETYVPFSSERAYTASVRQGPQGRLLVVSGAPEVLIMRSRRGEIAGRAVPLGSDDKGELRALVGEKAGEGLRTIAVAYRTLSPQEKVPSLHEEGLWRDFMEDLTLIGIVGLRDPVREDVASSLLETSKAGIRTVMVTGDHARTALSVAGEVGLLRAGRHAFVHMEGREVGSLSDEELVRQVRNVDVFSRVSPEHKLRITRAWQEHGEVVATCGDGVNDAPALKLANVGVALGAGTDLAKEASDIILLKDSFTTIVAAVREGRVIIDNLKKAITYMLSDSFTEILLLSVAILAGLPLPILPAQILWAKVVADVGPGIALAFEPAERDVMRMRPVSSQVSLIDREMRFLILIVGFLTDAILVGLFLFFLGQDMAIENVRTIIFAALSIETLLYAFSMRSLRRPLWRISLFSNKYLLGAVLLGAVMTLLAVYVPPFSTLMRTVPLTGLEWLIIVGFGIVNVIAIETGKWLYWRKKTQQA